MRPQLEIWRVFRAAGRSPLGLKARQRREAARRRASARARSATAKTGHPGTGRGKPGQVFRAAVASAPQIAGSMMTMSLLGSFAARAAWCRRIIALALGLLFAQPAGALEPAPEGAEHRTPVDATSYPWSAVGALFNSSRTECTAVAIAPDQVLTAAHCLFSQRTGRLMQPDSLHVLLGFVRGKFEVNASVRSYHIAAGYDHARPRDSVGADWAVLRLDPPLPEDHRPLPLADRLPATGTAVEAGGYGQDRAFMMTADSHCRVVRVATTGMILWNDCHTIHGYSGGPLLAWANGTDRVEIVGVNVAVTVIGPPVTVTVPAAAIRRELEAAAPSVPDADATR